MARKDKKRSDELRDDEGLREQALEVFEEVLSGFDTQRERVDDIQKYWDAYNCVLTSEQFYNGNSQIFVPIVRSAINARKTRFVNQLFPSTQRHVQCVAEDGGSPNAQVSLLEHYVRKAKLRTQILPALVRAGDIEGQYSIYVSWIEDTRKVVWKEQLPVPVEIDGVDGEDSAIPGLELDDGVFDPDETIEDMRDETLRNGRPHIEVIADADICLTPATADSVEQALDEGGALGIARRWRKGKVQAMVRAGHIDKEAGEKLIGLLSSEDSATVKDSGAAKAYAAGIKRDARGLYVLVYEIWAKLETDEDDEPELYVMYAYGGETDELLSIKCTPYWHGRVPLLSAPVEKVNGSFKGVSQVKAVASLQYQANDAVNEGMDSAAYALLPIIMTDPEKNPRVGSMILSLAAVWEVDPKSTQFAQFPQLWKDALGIVATCKAEIYEHLSVSPAKITQQASTKKLTQAEIASEQQVDLLNTADAVTTLEEEILSPMLEMFVELDHQFRDKELTVREFGPMGISAKMQAIEPLQFDKRYTFQWLGVEASRNAQAIQQQIAAVNVLRTIPPEQYQGYKIDLAPVIMQLVENVFGPRLAPQVFKDLRSQLSVNPAEENQYMLEGMEMPVHPFDNHEEHMLEHQKALEGGDSHGTVRIHLMQHQKALLEQAQAQQQTVMPQPQGGRGPTPPRSGAQPGAIRNTQQPAGAIHQDRMQDPGRMPPPAGTPYA